MSTINPGEVLYILSRRLGFDAASHVVATILQTPKIQLLDATWERVRAAAQLKADGGISYADCFAAALALETGAAVLTADPEFRRLESAGRLRVAWLGRSEQA